MAGHASSQTSPSDPHLVLPPDTLFLFFSFRDSYALKPVSVITEVRFLPLIRVELWEEGIALPSLVARSDAGEEDAIGQVWTSERGRVEGCAADDEHPM